MNLYLPERGVLLVAEQATHTLHNLLTLRGAQVRDAQAWAGYLTEAIQLFGAADVLIGSHHWPAWGRAEVARALTLQRDAYAYLHDQTVRLMNRGLTGAEIAEELTEFPGELGRAWALRGYYGSISHNVKAVYQRYMGWYDGNPAHLWPHPPAAAAARYVEAMGGADAVVALAGKSFHEGDLRWAAELLNHVVFAEPAHAAARELLARTYERLARAQENAIWRNIYLTGARELRSADAPKPNLVSKVDNPDVLSALTTGQLFHALAVRLDGPRAASHRLVLRWEFTDAGETWTVLVGNGVLTPMRGDAPGGEQPRLTLRMRRADFVSVLAGLATFEEMAGSGAVRLAGDATALATLTGLLEAPDRNFAIVTP
jgi:alkyl sulfatase BDS1-like metallo-beta-lactamase superfamily hydrolase